MHTPCIFISVPIKETLHENVVIPHERSVRHMKGAHNLLLSVSRSIPKHDCTATISGGLSTGMHTAIAKRVADFQGTTGATAQAGVLCVGTEPIQSH